MDSVIGEKGSKCLLTIHFVECSFMLALPREANTSKSVTAVSDTLYQTLEAKLFKKLFPVILTDNRSEFSNPKSIEYGSENCPGLRAKVFYCDAGSPYQKAAIEVFDYKEASRLTCEFTCELFLKLFLNLFLKCF